MGVIARPTGELTRCGGKWTEAYFRNFVKNQLRSATRKWAPIQQCKKNARVGYGEYKCSCCENIVPPTVYDPDKGKRVVNVFVDHIHPVVDPNIGWTTWDDVVNHMFCEADNLQLLCAACHKVKSQEEIDIAKARRAKEKLQNE